MALLFFLLQKIKFATKHILRGETGLQLNTPVVPLFTTPIFSGARIIKNEKSNLLQVLRPKRNLV